MFVVLRCCVGDCLLVKSLVKARLATYIYEERLPKLPVRDEVSSNKNV